MAIIGISVWMKNVFYDLPTSIDYIKKKTNQEKIHFIGHSQGTTLFIMLYMDNPTYVESSISSFISLGTMPTITYIDFSPINAVDQIYKLLLIPKTETKAIIFSATQRNLLSTTCQKLPDFCKNTIETYANRGANDHINYKKIYPFFY